MIIGKRLYLRCLDKQDIYKVMNWRNQPHVHENIFSFTFINSYQQEQWFEKYAQDSRQESFMIVLKETEEEIGVIGLSYIDYKNGTAVLNTMIGEKRYWGKGYATEASIYIINYAFNELNLNRITSFFYESNKAIINKNLKLGFKMEGKLRQLIFSKGKFQDVGVMGLLREDWVKIQDSIGNL